MIGSIYIMIHYINLKTIQYRELQLINMFKDVEHKCEICAKKFKAKLYLKKHLKTHETSSVFQCEKCEKVFQSKDALRLHIKTKQSKLKSRLKLKW